jgi:hypothetical protein
MSEKGAAMRRSYQHRREKMTGGSFLLGQEPQLVLR